MTKKEKRENWKRIGLCSTCGKNKPVSGMVTCQHCLDMMKQNRDYKREHNLCVKCGRNKVAPNRKYCDECLEQKRNKYEKYKTSQEYISSVKLQYKKRTDNRKKNGLCVKCGKPVFENRTLCYEHLIEQRNYMRAKRASEKIKGELLWT